MAASARRRATWDDDSFAAEEGKPRAAHRVARELEEAQAKVGSCSPRGAG